MIFSMVACAAHPSRVLLFLLPSGGGIWTRFLLPRFCGFMQCGVVGQRRNNICIHIVQFSLDNLALKLASEQKINTIWIVI
jgi:hypothetical protein